MKKIFKTAIVAIMCIMMSITGASAAGEMEIEWYGDYSDSTNPKLFVTFSSPVQYQQQILAVIYPASDTTPTFEEYLRMRELTVSGSEEKTTVFDITDEFTEMNFDYKIALQGSGHMHDVSSVTETVYFINPGRIPGIINEFKNSTIATLPDVLDKVIAPLQLTDELNPDIKAKKIEIMYAMKDTYSTLDDVRNAWKSANVLVYINDSSSSTAAGITQKLIDNAEILGIDINDSDFKKYVDENPLTDDEGDGIPDSNELCEKIRTYAPLYNNGAGIKSVNDLKDLIGELLGLIVVNDSTEDTVDDSFAKYKDYLNIDSDTMSAYNNLNEGNRGKALRAIYNKNFTTVSQLVDAFKTAVITLSAGGDIGGAPIIIVQGGNGGNIGGGDSSIASPVEPTTTAPPSSTTGLKDVPSSHWAYSYVTELSNKGIISGYDDNTFRPNNNVTREEFVKMIVGATGLYRNDAECEFADVPNTAWYYRYVASAYINEIVNGVTDTSFGIGHNITRQDVAVIAARILTRFEKETTVNATMLTDIDTVSDYAQESVELLNSMGIINGFDDGSFKPHNALTRAEAATIISKLINCL